MKASAVRNIAHMRMTEFRGTLAMLRAQVNSYIMEAVVQNAPFARIQVPSVYVGREAYDQVEMGRQLVNQLREDGYDVQGTYVDFYVRWMPQIAKTASIPPPSAGIISVPKTKRR